MKKIIILITLCFQIILFTATSAFGINIGDKSIENLDSSKIVYLTFDDGPGGKITSKVLDILKENDVKATFFVIGKEAQAQPELTKRIVDEGHVVGVHTFTHDRHKVYSSPDTFLSENLQCQEIIEEITGVKASALRFPFGCNNALYKLTDSMVSKLHESGFRIYDWNVDTTDGMNPGLVSYKIAENARSEKGNAIILMHCGTVNKNTPDALPQIIKYYKEHGYEFKTIDENTPEIYRVKKRS